LSLGAWVEESLSTRLDSVRAPERLCVDEDLLEPDARLREFPLERLLDEDERPFDLEEPFDFEEPFDLEEPRELAELLLLDRDFCWGILPGSSSWISQCVLAAYPNPTVQTARIPPFKARPEPTVQIRSSAGNANTPPARKALLARKAKRGEKEWRRQSGPRAEARREATRGRRDRRIGAVRREAPGRVPLGRAPGGAARTRAGRRRLGVAVRPPRSARNRMARWPRPVGGPPTWRRRRRARCWPVALPWPGSPAGWR
jgi:hypothetical protein